MTTFYYFLIITRLVVDSDKPESCGVVVVGGGPQDFSDKSRVGLVNFRMCQFRDDFNSNSEVISKSDISPGA